MADSFAVAARYQFSGNALEWMARLAELSEVVARNLGAVEKAVSGVGRGMSRAATVNRSYADSYAGITRNANAAAAAIERVGEANRTAGGGRGPGAGGFMGGMGDRAGGFLRGATTVAGLGSLALVASGVRNASAFQNAELQAAIATGKMGPTYDATMKNMAPLRAQAYRMSALTGGSAVDMMQVIQNLASSGFNAKQLDAMQRPIAQLTDVLHFGKSQMSFADAATQAAGLAHDLRLYNTADASAGFNRLAQLQYQAPHGISQLITQTRRFAPQFEKMLPGDDKAAKASQILEYTAWLDRLGSLQFGGTGLNMLATYLQHPKTRGQMSALEDLGLYSGGRSIYTDTRTGTYNLPAALEQVAKRYGSALDAPGGRARVNTDIRSLSANASRIFETLTTPDALAALAAIRVQTKAMPNLDQIQSQLMETPGHAFARLVTNIESLSTIIGDRLVPPLGVIAANLAGSVGRANDYLSSHPREASAAAAVASIGAVYGAYRLFHMIGGFAAFGHIAEHAARESAGISVGAYARKTVVGDAMSAMRGLGKVGSLFGTGVDLFPTVARLDRAVGELFEGFGKLGPRLFLTRGGLEALGSALGRIGLRAIPVAGNLMLIWEAIKAMVTHGTDLSAIAGKAAAWMDVVGKPMLVNAITGAWNAAIAALLNAVPATLGFIGDSVKNMFSGGTSSGLQGMQMNAARWIHKQQNDNTWAENNAYRAYQARYGSRQGNVAFNPAALNMHIYGNVNLPGVKNGSDLGKAFADYRHQNARVGGAPTSPFAPPALSLGIGSGR